MTTTSKPCKKCGGTGYLRHFAHSDGGRCWSCQGVADTSYTKAIEAAGFDPEAHAVKRAADLAAAAAARRARRAAL